jgi:hypothetical protein
VGVAGIILVRALAAETVIRHFHLYWKRGTMNGTIALAGTAAMAVAGILSTTAAMSAPVPSGAQAGGGSAPMASHGRTYVNEHGSDGNSHVAYEPSTFWLLNTRSASLYTTSTEWNSSAVAFGPMHGHRSTDQYNYHLVGHVVLQFSHRLSNAHFIESGRGYSYYENVRISGIRPGNGGSVQHWHWSWRADNWVNNR